MAYFEEHQIFTINSQNRSSGTNSNFTYELDIDRNVAYDRVVVLDASIPKSYYTIQNGYNTFLLTEGLSTRTITVTPGNYTRTSFKNELLDKLNTGGVGWTYSITLPNIGITVDNGHLYFSVTGNSSSQPIFTFENYLYEQMGFNDNESYAFSGDQLESVNVINLNPEQTLFIRSDICQNQNNNILDNIITSSNTSFSQINYVNNIPLESSKIFNGNNANTFKFMLTDENGVNIDLQGQNMIFTIMIYKSNKIFKLLQGFIKYLTIKT